MGNRFDTQDKLIAATRRIIINEGLEATSLEHICKVAGFTRGAFYSNFSSKDSLLAALAEDEYSDLIDRLRSTVDRWAQRPTLGDGETPVLDSLLIEALDAIGIDEALYILNSELIMRSIRDPEWGVRLFDINSQFVDELGRLLEWILTASGRELTRPLRPMTHAIIGIAMRAAGVASWRLSVPPIRDLSSPTLTGTQEIHPGELSGGRVVMNEDEAGVDSCDKAARPRPSVRDSAGAEIIDVILVVMYASSRPRE